jgi:hypothetical protein
LFQQYIQAYYVAPLACQTTQPPTNDSLNVIPAHNSITFMRGTHDFYAATQVAQYALAVILGEYDFTVIAQCALQIFMVPMRPLKKKVCHSI